MRENGTQIDVNFREDIHEDAKTLIAGMLVVDPKKRISISKATDSKWFIGISWLNAANLNFKKLGSLA